MLEYTYTTVIGEEYISYTLAGKRLKLTIAQFGDGVLAGDKDQKQQKALVHHLGDMPISKQVVTGNNIVTTTQFSNKVNGDVLPPFHLMEIGLFGKLLNEDGTDDTAHPEALLFYINAVSPEHADEIPGILTEYIINWPMSVSNTEQVTAVISESLVYPTKAEFDQTVIELRTESISAGRITDTQSRQMINTITTEGTGEAYTATLPGLTEYYKGLTVLVCPHTASTAKMFTLDINGLGPRQVRQIDSSGGGVVIAPTNVGWFSKAQVHLLVYNGLRFTVMNSVPLASRTYNGVARFAGRGGVDSVYDRIYPSYTNDSNIENLNDEKYTYEGLYHIYFKGSATGVPSGLDANTQCFATMETLNHYQTDKAEIVYGIKQTLVIAKLGRTWERYGYMGEATYGEWRETGPITIIDLTGETYDYNSIMDCEILKTFMGVNDTIQEFYVLYNDHSETYQYAKLTVLKSTRHTSGPNDFVQILSPLSQPYSNNCVYYRGGNDDGEMQWFQWTKVSVTVEDLDTKADKEHTHTKTQVGLGNVPNVSTNDQTPTYTEASSLTNLSSGEKLSVAFGKIKKAVAEFIAHKGNTSNPHGVTKVQVGLGNVPNVATNDQTPTFTEAGTLTNLTSGEKLNVSFGKIKRVIAEFITHKSNTSNPHGITKAQLGLAYVDNTSDLNKPISYAVQNELNNRPLSHIKIYAGTTDIIDGSLIVGYVSEDSELSQGTLVAGGGNTVRGLCMSVIGSSNTVTAGQYGLVCGWKNSVSAGESFTSGCDNILTSNGRYSIVSGYRNTVDSAYSCAIGTENKVTGERSACIGYANNVSGNYAFACCALNKVTGYAGFAFGQHCIAEDRACAGGESNTAHAFNTVIGRYAQDPIAGSYTGTNGDVLVVGKGTSSARSNAFRVDYTGKGFFANSSSSTGADYAEMWEWQDGNPDGEDRTGRFVAMQGDKIRFATGQDNSFKLGVISARPAVVGDNYADEWQGKYLTDIFGRYLTEHKVYEAVEEEIDSDGNMITPAREAYEAEEYILNPDYNGDEEYIPREQRQEWDYVGTHGKLVVIDDGTCQVDGCCYPDDSGIATEAENGFYVMERLDDTHIRVYIK